MMNLCRDILEEFASFSSYAQDAQWKHQAYVEAYALELQETRSAWARNNKPKTRANAARYYQANRTQILAKRKLRSPEERRASYNPQAKAEYYAKNKEAILAKNRARRKK